MRVSVDPNRCQGHTLCTLAAPDFFVLDDIDGHSSAKTPEVPPELVEAVRTAAATCPEQAIVVDVNDK
jgi:ferredoxin